MLDRPEGAVRDRVKGLVTEILRRNAIARPVGTADELVAVGLTSIDMVHLMLAVEVEFDLVIPRKDITPENFRSVASIERMIAKLVTA